MIEPFDDAYFMKKALQEAEVAFEQGEVPVGAVIVIDNRVIARGHNLTETLNDVTAHAEMQAITAAANFLGTKTERDEYKYYEALEHQHIGEEPAGEEHEVRQLFKNKGFRGETLEKIVQQLTEIDI